MDGRLGVTVVLFIWWNGICMELGGEFHDPMASTTKKNVNVVNATIPGLGSSNVQVSTCDTGHFFV